MNILDILIKLQDAREKVVTYKDEIKRFEEIHPEYSEAKSKKKQWELTAKELTEQVRHTGLILVKEGKELPFGLKKRKVSPKYGYKITDQVKALQWCLSNDLGAIVIDASRIADKFGKELPAWIEEEVIKEGGITVTIPSDLSTVLDAEGSN